MAFVVSSLPNYVQENRDLLLRKAVLGGNFIERMTKQTGIKKDAYINYLAVSPTFASGASCGFSAAGDTTFTQRTINTADIKINMSWCPKTLVGKWTEYQVRISANPEAENLPFEEEIISQILAEANAKREKLIWQGDTSSSDTQLAFHDGLIKIANADSNVIDVTVASGSSAYDAIKSVYMSIPEVMLGKAEIYVNPSLFRQFVQELVEKNYYHYNAGESNLREIVFPGSDTKVVKVEGLTGASKIFAADPKELFFGCDLENASEDFRMWYSDDDDLFKLKVDWNQGVNYAFGDHIVLGAYTTITSPAANAVNLGTIATGVTSLATVASDVHDTTNHAIKTKEAA